MTEKEVERADQEVERAANLVDHEANDKDRAANLVDREANQVDRAAIQTDRETHQVALIESANKDTFIATVVHELRNPIGPIKNSIQVLEAQFGPHKAFDIINRQTVKIERFVNDLLDVARIKSGKFSLDKKPICLCVLAKDAMNNFPQENIVIECRVQEAVVQGDGLRLDQVVTNLLFNAIRYTKLNDGKIKIVVDKNENYATLSVVDTGVGIPADVKGHLFDLFFQEGNKENPGSLGVGLFLCKSIVDGHDGKIVVDSHGPNTGSTFTIHLPLAIS